jgi:hypothetical protein
MIGGKERNFRGVKGAESRRVARSERGLWLLIVSGSEKSRRECHAYSEQKGGPDQELGKHPQSGVIPPLHCPESFEVLRWLA